MRLIEEPDLPLGSSRVLDDFDTLQGLPGRNVLSDRVWAAWSDVVALHS